MVAAVDWAASDQKRARRDPKMSGTNRGFSRMFGTSPAVLGDRRAGSD